MRGWWGGSIPPPPFMHYFTHLCTHLITLPNPFFSVFVMLFEVNDRVKGLSTLFDEGTEDENGRLLSQREQAKGNGLYCSRNVKLCHKARGRFVSPPSCMHFLPFNPPPACSILLSYSLRTPPPPPMLTRYRRTTFVWAIEFSQRQKR